MRQQLQMLGSRIDEIARRQNVPYRINSATAMFTGFFSKSDVIDYETAFASDRGLYELFFKSMLAEGFFFAPSQFEAAFLTTIFDDAMMEQTVEAYSRVFKRMKDAR